MPKTRAHTVSRFLLDGFAFSNVDGRRLLWVADLNTGELVLRSAKEHSIVKGYYDGRGGLSAGEGEIENHLSKLESDAAPFIRALNVSDVEAGVPTEVWRLISWQAARTPGWLELIEAAANDQDDGEAVEPPPPGFDEIGDRVRPLTLEHSTTKERVTVQGEEQFRQLRKEGWRWVFGMEDRLEAMHLQAWYFRVRHFPRLHWMKLIPADDDEFIIGDRGVTWLVDGYADAAPTALRHEEALVIAPLSGRLALIGKHGQAPLRVTPRQVNRLTAFANDRWIAGANRGTVELALSDRNAGLVVVH